VSPVAVKPAKKRRSKGNKRKNASFSKAKGNKKNILLKKREEKELSKYAGRTNYAISSVWLHNGIVITTQEIMEAEFREALKGWAHFDSVMGNTKLESILEKHGNGGS
jgi:hypothetical protein